MRDQLDRIAGELTRLQDALAREQAALANEREARQSMERYAEQMEQALRGVLGSSSWKLARPLRRLLAKLRGHAADLPLRSLAGVAQLVAAFLTARVSAAGTVAPAHPGLADSLLPQWRRQLARPWTVTSLAAEAGLSASQVAWVTGSEDILGSGGVGTLWTAFFLGWAVASIPAKPLKLPPCASYGKKLASVWRRWALGSGSMSACSIFPTAACVLMSVFIWCAWWIQL